VKYHWVPVSDFLDNTTNKQLFGDNYKQLKISSVSTGGLQEANLPP
jgi:hypothetical protein